MKFNIFEHYLITLEKKIKFCNEFDFFGLKIIHKNIIGKYTKNEINLFEYEYQNSLLGIEEKDINNVNYIEIKNRNKEIIDLLVNLCMRKGNKKLAYNNVKKTFLLLRKFFWLNAMLLIRLILVQSESLFIIQKFSLGKREKIIPRFIPFQKKTKFVLRMLVDHARNTQKDYRYFYISLANTIIEYSLPNNVLIQKNREENQLAELNKFFLIKKKKKKKKVRLFRKIDNWKE